MPVAPQIADRVSDMQVGPPGAQGRSWRDLDYTFDVEASTGRTPNKATVTIWGLSRESQAFIQRPGQSLRILVGTGGAGQLFYGDISRRDVATKWAPPDWPTEIKAADGRRVFRESLFVASYPPGITRAQITADVIANMGLAVGYIDPNLAPVTYATGLTFAHHSREVLSALYSTDKASWSIQHGTVWIMAAGRPKVGQSLLISAQTGMIGSPTKTNKGISFDFLLTSAIAPGSVVVMDSRLIKGGYRVVKVKYKGHRRGNPWQLKADAVDY